jgi:hypothetical protein
MLLALLILLTPLVNTGLIISSKNLEFSSTLQEFPCLKSFYFLFSHLCNQKDRTIKQAFIQN